MHNLTHETRTGTAADGTNCASKFIFCINVFYISLCNMFGCTALCITFLEVVNTVIEVYVLTLISILELIVTCGIVLLYLIQKCSEYGPPPSAVTVCVP
jgi:hypothetical protein